MKHFPLPTKYLNQISKLDRVRLTIVGKDPYPNDAAGIPFYKSDWKDLLSRNCSGRFALQSLGADPDRLQDQYPAPTDCFFFLAKQGIVFLNLSYHFVNGPILKRHEPQLRAAAKVNTPIFKKSDMVLLCGDAKKNRWYGYQPQNVQDVIHPDKRNKIHPKRCAQWQVWWAPNALKNKYKLDIGPCFSN